MKKMNWFNGMQRLLIVVCIMSVMTGLFVTKGNVAQADDKKAPMCSLQSVTLEIEGEEYTFDGEMGTFVVDQSTKWEEMFGKDSIKVVDYKVLANDECTHESGHDNLVIELDGLQLLEYVSDTTSYNNITDEQWEDMFIHCVDLTVYLDDGEAGQIKVHFAKEYNIAYDEKSLEGVMDVITGEAPSLPTTYVYGMDVGKIPILEREGFTFYGWTWKTEMASDTEGSIGFKTCWIPGGDATLTAQWTEEPRIDISDGTFEVDFDPELETEYSGEEITPSVGVYSVDSETDAITYLRENIDYVVLYKNNVEVASKEDTNPPTVIVKGVGVYTGEITCNFSIIKAELYPDYNDISLVEGSTLSELDLNAVVEVRSNVNDETVAGTWEWNAPDTKVALTNDDEYPSYEATFTPTDVDHYQVLVTDIYVRVGASIENWIISLVDKDVLTYTGKAHKPKVIVMNEDVQMVEEEDYDISYVNNVNAGDKSDKKAPVVIVEGIGNYVGTKRIAFTIEKASPSVETAPSASAIEEGKKLSDSTLSGGKVFDITGKVLAGEFSWKDGNVVPALTDSGATKYTVVFTPSDTNYKEIETTVVVTVNQKEQTPDPQPTPDPTPNPDPQPTPDPTPNPDPQPTPDPTPNPDPQPIITVGDNITDKDNKATYQVTKSAEGKVEVSYVAPNSKTKKVTIPATITLEDGTTAKVTDVAEGAFKKNTKLQEITIGKNVKTIGKEAFSGCTNLKKVKSAKNVTSIGKNAFANCKKLSSVAMGSKLTTIGEKAFYNCKALKKITIPKNVKSIGKSAFQNCKNLKNINIKTTKLTKKNVKKNAFKGIYSKAKIDVPNSKAKEYKKIFTSRGVGKKATIK